MPNTREDLIQTLVSRKLYPKKKLNTTPLKEVKLNPNYEMGPLQTKELAKGQIGLTLQQPVQPLPVQPPITQMKLPTIPLQKILFLKRTIGI